MASLALAVVCPTGVIITGGTAKLSINSMRDEVGTVKLV